MLVSVNSHHVLAHRDRLFRYGISILVTSAALLLSFALSRFIGESIADILLLPIIAFSAWYFGMGPALVASILAFFTMENSRVFLFGPLAVHDPARRATFLVASAALIAMGEARRRYNQKREKEEAELEARVKERTKELDIANHNLRQLSAHLLELQDDERRRIARELHDSVGQLLVGLTLNLSAVRSDIEHATLPLRCCATAKPWCRN